MIFRFHKDFIKSYKKTAPSLKKAVDLRLLLFSKNIFAVELCNHPLKGKYQGYRSINITGDWRAIYKELGGDEMIFVKLGTHTQLYG